MKKTPIQIISFLCVGVCVVLFNVALLSFLTEQLHIWYLFASIISYSLSVLLNFTLQKFFVFQSDGEGNTHKQLIWYVLVSIVYLSINTVSMYVFVQWMHIHYTIAQVLITLGLSVVNFFVNKHFIFKV